MLSFLGPDVRPLQDQDQARRAKRTGHSMGQEKIHPLPFLVGSRVKQDEKHHFAIGSKPLLQPGQLQPKIHPLGVRHTFFKTSPK